MTDIAKTLDAPVHDLLEAAGTTRLDVSGAHAPSVMAGEPCA